MSIVADDVLPGTQLVLDDKTFVAQPLKALAADGAITVVSLDLTRGSEYSVGEARKLLGWLGLMNRATNWWIGDALIQFQQIHPEEFSQLIEALGLSESAAQARMFVCENISPDRRKPGLGFSMHFRVAKLSAREQRYWLDRAERGGWNYKTLVAEMAAKRRETHPPLGEGMGEPGDVDEKLLMEAAQAVVSAKQDYGADWLVPREPMARLCAALGMED